MNIDANCDFGPAPPAPHGHPAGPPAKGPLGIEHAQAKVQSGPDKLIDATTDKKHSEITTVKITGNSAVIVGTDDNGNSFLILLTDGGKGKDATDTVQIVIKNHAGAVIFDSSTLTAKHDASVEIKLAK